ncbi:hypothetical protein ASPVEDRAFT_65322 [Aspergillus versicolor CBS 583.65]|uniref:Uncharacterized protein n=1 Tax=Aspergillus versicolor CBS 583.65 TaxID=1036611 RepID=A0A1L9PYV7_ASPVE|nr:uncharacterized protein ASPVEDRAFT_65322 [Aspergillus versicolor CBS 583.65]OJJ06719.1 hypothetical protein ASPVEDRAFT_65322 [Aspergillus versicolor CBS 583.65]
MDRTEEVNMGNLDEADQLPVKDPTKDANPLCYICSSDFTEFDGRTKLMTGIYCPESVNPYFRNREGGGWCRFYRMILFHPQKRICRLSGVSYFSDKDLGFHTRQAPWDEDKLIIRSESNPSMHEELLVTALQHEAQHPSAPGRLTCFMMHARCWQLLRRHKAWTLSGGDIKIILKALRHKSARDWNDSLYSPDEFITLLLEKGFQILYDFMDPFHCSRAQEIIRQARRRTKRRFQVIQHAQKETYLDRLPPEILRLTADLLPSADVAAVQKAIGSYLGDAYWRSRVPDLFHEVQDLSSETLDWEYLCFELERLEFDWNKQLDGRRYVLQHLDVIASFVSDMICD